MDNGLARVRSFMEQRYCMGVQYAVGNARLQAARRVSARPCSNARAGVQRSHALQCSVGLAPASRCVRMKPCSLLFVPLALQSAQAGELSRKQWGDLFVAAASSQMCADGTYFRECLSLTAPQCEQAAVSAAQVCLDGHANRLPLTFTSKQQSQDAGELIGQCVGRTMDDKFSPARVANAKCRDPRAWKR